MSESKPQKLYHRLGDDWRPHSHEPIFAVENPEGGKPRIVACVPGGDPDLVRGLVECLSPPFMLLYILHTPRGEGEPGRYQSPPFELPVLQAFFRRFGPYLSGDSRFDLWIHSPSDKGTIVWDRHNLIFGYGPIDRFAKLLTELGFSDATPNVPSPHLHQYREEFDSDAKLLLTSVPWRQFPLQPEDEQ